MDAADERRFREFVSESSPALMRLGFLLTCSVGTVRSTAHRSLARLRGVAERRGRGRTPAMEAGRAST